MKKFLVLTLATLFSVGAFAQQQSKINAGQKYSIAFAFDSDVVNPEIGNNREVINELVEYMNGVYQDDETVVTSIIIDSRTSPEGGCRYNKELSERRSQNFYNYIAGRTKFSSDLYTIRGTGINWDQLITLVEESDLNYKDEVLNILRNTPEETWRKLPGNSWKTLVDSRNKQLMDLRGGVPYKTMQRDIFPLMRTGSAINLYFKPQKADTVVVEKVDTVYKVKTQERIRVMSADSGSSSLTFAIKSNLLDDLAFIPNLELEVPIQDRFSVNAEFGRMWWSRDDKTRCWQVQNYGIEGRYWFGDRSDWDLLTGFFAGVYLSRSTFDFQLHHDRGMQGEIDFSMGLSGGYSTHLSGNFNLEFSAAIGYVNGYYNRYNIREGYAAEGEQLYKYGETRDMPHIFPTKAKVSLVWMIGNNR